jgi:hypothetical protein
VKKFIALIFCVLLFGCSQPSKVITTEIKKESTKVIYSLNKPDLKMIADAIKEIEKTYGTAETIVSTVEIYSYSRIDIIITIREDIGNSDCKVEDK